MMQNLISAAVYEMLSFLKKNPDFFALKSEEKKDKMRVLHLPSDFKDYLAERSRDSFLEDLQSIFRAESNEFSKAFCGFLTGSFADHLDALNSDFYLMSTEDRQKTVEKNVEGEAAFYDAWRELISIRNLHEITESIYALCHKMAKTPYVVVQSAREISPEQKKEIRHALLKEDAMVFPNFQINRSLIGGLRVFKDGETVDHSWFSRVQHYISLTSA